ncbi:hypothetical protein Msi02_36820 [Microbispora siamensis]|uniref:Uncharacterized protein n=1 Tax=Microbispora siamensis TaxID=564413 RepID=A0ABQ4GN55_9ACTN|nr:hypothetical protein Msi02_36820 [Microbispora siamensis]
MFRHFDRLTSSRQTVGMRKDDHPGDVEALLLDPNSQIRASQDESACGEGAWAGGAEAVEGYLRQVVADLNRVPDWWLSTRSSDTTAPATRHLWTSS